MRFLRIKLAISIAMPVLTASELYTATQGQQFLKTQCAGCESGKAAAGNFDIANLAQPDSVRVRSAAWSKAALRVRNGEMPPKSTLSMDAREGFFAGVSESLRTEACAAGMVPGPAPARRLSRSQ